MRAWSGNPRLKKSHGILQTSTSCLKCLTTWTQHQKVFINKKECTWCMVHELLTSKCVIKKQTNKQTRQANHHVHISGKSDSSSDRASARSVRRCPCRKRTAPWLLMPREPFWCEKMGSVGDSEHARTPRRSTLICVRFCLSF